MATQIVSFKDAAKIKSWDAWQDHIAKTEITSILQKEKPCVTWQKLLKLDPPGLLEVGRLKTRTSSEIKASDWAVGCECMDRDYSDWDSYKELIPMLGVKHARFLSGWAKTEQEKNVYDFTWLDPHIRECAAMGIKPWICLSYGNPVWGSDFRLGMRVKQITDNKEAFAAWLRYCKACVERYKDIVDEWEVWNEPFGQGPEYSVLFYETAKVVRSVMPDAKIYCTAITYPTDYTAVLEKLKKENALDFGSRFIYHPYIANPDHTYQTSGANSDIQSALNIRKLVKSYSEKFDIMQGEVGCPSQLEFAHALANHEWTEYSQAKWNLRRAIGDAVHSIPSSLFTMIDLQYTFMLQSFGLVRSNALKEFVYRRPSWYAMRNVYAIFDEDTKPLSVSEITFEKDKTMTKAEFTRFGKKLELYWFSDSIPSSDLSFELVELGKNMKDPVWIDMITGRVFRPLASGLMPMWDSPVLVAEADAIPFESKTPILSDFKKEWFKEHIAEFRPLKNRTGNGPQYIRTFKVDGKTVTISDSETILNLKAIYPEAVVVRRDGERWADIEFTLTSGKLDFVTLQYGNDYYGELFVNGEKIGEPCGPFSGWSDMVLPLRKGVNYIKFRTRSGSGGGWHCGFTIPAGCQAGV